MTLTFLFSFFSVPFLCNQHMSWPKKNTQLNFDFEWETSAVFLYCQFYSLPKSLLIWWTNWSVWLWWTSAPNRAWIVYRKPYDLQTSFMLSIRPELSQWTLYLKTGKDNYNQGEHIYVVNCLFQHHQGFIPQRGHGDRRRLRWWTTSAFQKYIWRIFCGTAR